MLDKTVKYTPKENHPWKKSYKVNLTKLQNGESEPARKIKPLKIFLVEIVENWTTMTINPDSLDFPQSSPISHYSDKQQAQWLVDFLNRYYVNGERW